MADASSEVKNHPTKSMREIIAEIQKFIEEVSYLGSLARDLIQIFSFISKFLVPFQYPILPLSRSRSHSINRRRGGGSASII